MDLILLAILNVLLFTFFLVYEYLLLVKKKQLFYSRVSYPDENKVSNILFFLPSFLFFRVKRSIAHTEGKNKSKTLIEDFTLGKIALLNIGIAIISINLMNLFKISIFVSLIIGVFAQIGLYFFAKTQQKKIKDEIEKRLPEILEIMARVYRVHSDLRICLHEVSTKMHNETIKKIFSEMVSLSRFGYTVEEAMENVARNIQSDDFDFIVTAIKLNIPVGGDLPHLFEHTAKLLRQRKDAKTEIDNLMFQSKISSIISALLVPAIIVVAFLSSDKYQEILLHNSTGRLVFFCCLFWWLLGVIIIRKNSRIRI